MLIYGKKQDGISLKNDGLKNTVIFSHLFNNFDGKSALMKALITQLTMKGEKCIWLGKEMLPNIFYSGGLTKDHFSFIVKYIYHSFLVKKEKIYFFIEDYGVLKKIYGSKLDEFMHFLTFYKKNLVLFLGTQTTDSDFGIGNIVSYNCPVKIHGPTRDKFLPFLNSANARNLVKTITYGQMFYSFIDKFSIFNQLIFDEKMLKILQGIKKPILLKQPEKLNTKDININIKNLFSSILDGKL